MFLLCSLCIFSFHYLHFPLHWYPSQHLFNLFALVLKSCASQVYVWLGLARKSVVQSRPLHHCHCHSLPITVPLYRVLPQQHCWTTHFQYFHLTSSSSIWWATSIQESAGMVCLSGVNVLIILLAGGISCVSRGDASLISGGNLMFAK